MSKKRVLLVVGLVAVALGVWFGVSRLRKPKAEVTYTTTAVEKTDVVAQVTATGTLSPMVLVEVGSQVSGTITELHADYNSRVKKGEVIARLDPRTFQSALAQAKARLISAQAGLRRAQAAAVNSRAQLGRSQLLVEKGVAARAELDTAIADRKTADAGVEVARAEVAQAKAAVEQAEVNLAYTTITSPIDGVVVSRSVDVGQTVAASMSAPVLFIIAEDLARMEVHTSVAESDVGQLKDGMRAEFTVDAFPRDKFVGSVKQVRFEATTVSNVVTYDAVVLVDNPDLKLRPGMTANVTFVVDEAKDVLAVPTRALRYRPANAATAGERQARGAREGRERPARAEGAGPRNRPQAVWVLRAGTPTRVRVEVGLSDGTQTAITGGELKAGDQVITADSAGGGAAPTNTPASQQGRGGFRPPRIL